MNQSNRSMSGFAAISMADAVFSTVSALAFVAFSGPVAGLLGPGVPAAAVLAVGLGLACWAAFHFHLARPGAFSPVKAEISMAGDALWVAASAALLIAAPSLFSALGVAAVLAAAVAVAAVGTTKFLTSRQAPSAAGSH